MVSATITSDSKIRNQALLKRRLRDNAVFRFGDNISGHRRTSKLVTLWNSGSVKNFFKKHALIRLLLFLVRIHNRESFPRHLLEINNGQDERVETAPLIRSSEVVAVVRPDVFAPTREAPPERQTTEWECTLGCCDALLSLFFRQWGLR